MNTPLRDYALNSSGHDEALENKLDEKNSTFETISNNPASEENYDIQYVAVLSCN